MIILKQFSKEEFVETPQDTTVSALSVSLCGGSVITRLRLRTFKANKYVTLNYVQ